MSREMMPGFLAAADVHFSGSRCRSVEMDDARIGKIIASRRTSTLRVSATERRSGGKKDSTLEEIEIDGAFSLS